MDIITIKLIERKTILPLDIVRYINEYVKYEIITDENFLYCVSLWFYFEEECLMRFGHISNWNTSRVTYISFS